MKLGESFRPRTAGPGIEWQPGAVGIPVLLALAGLPQGEAQRLPGRERLMLSYVLSLGFRRRQFPLTCLGLAGLAGEVLAFLVLECLTRFGIFAFVVFGFGLVRLGERRRILETEPALAEVELAGVGLAALVFSGTALSGHDLRCHVFPCRAPPALARSAAGSASNRQPKRRGMSLWAVRGVLSTRNAGEDPRVFRALATRRLLRAVGSPPR